MTKKEITKIRKAVKAIEGNYYVADIDISILNYDVYMQVLVNGKEIEIEYKDFKTFGKTKILDVYFGKDETGVYSCIYFTVFETCILFRVHRGDEELLKIEKLFGKV